LALENRGEGVFYLWSENSENRGDAHFQHEMRRHAREESMLRAFFIFFKNGASGKPQARRGEKMRRGKLSATRRQSRKRAKSN